MKKILKPFQTIGAEFLAKNPHAFLADEMGLGKTVTALAAVELRKMKRVAVVCPASVRSGWKQEIAECGLSTTLPGCEFHIDSYEAAVRQKFPAGPYDAVILDEAHFLKTVDSQRTQAIFGNDTGLVRNATFKWPLSGTPVLNRPREVYPVLKTLAGERLGKHGTWETFTQYFCGAFFDGRGINTRGASHVDELAAILNGFMLRRTRKEVGLQIPSLLSRPPLTLTDSEIASVYAVEDEVQNREAYLSPTYEAYSQLGDLARLWKATGVAKVRALADFCDDLLDTTDKIVVFCRHHDVMRNLENALGHQLPVLFHGKMNDTQKNSAKRRFMDDKDCCVFIGQIAAAGTGLDGLQKVCSTVVFGELSWVPKELEQATGRCDRIGQTASHLHFYMPHVPGTLESAMFQVHSRKNAVIDRLMDPTLSFPIDDPLGVLAGVDLSGLEGLI